MKEKGYRIKLRLYPMDLDLLGIAQTKAENFRFANFVREVLLEYVESGQVTHKQIPEPAPRIIKKVETLDISLTGKYAAVAEWLKSLRDGHRSNVIKILLRAAMPEPFIHVYDANYPVDDGEQKQQGEAASAMNNRRQPAPAAVTQPSKANAWPDDVDDVDIFDLVENS